jgi:hypothetical protein
MTTRTFSFTVTSSGGGGSFTAQPGFTLAPGSYTHGSTITIGGTGFGAGPTEAHNFEPVIEAATVGSELLGTFGRWVTGPGVGVDHPLVISDPVRGKVLAKQTSARGASEWSSNVGVGWLAEMPQNTRFYASYWVQRTLQVFDSSRTQSGQHKTIRLSSDWSDPNILNPEVAWLYSIWSPGSPAIGSNDDYVSNDFGGFGTSQHSSMQFIDETTTEWVRLEMEGNTGTDDVVDSGFVRMGMRIRNGLRITRQDVTGPTPPCTFFNRAANIRRPDGMMFVNYFGNGYNGVACLCRHGDHHAQYGSFARIELTNSATWGAETNSEVQVPVTGGWSASQVQCKLNLGAFTSVSGLHLHLVNDDGTTRYVGRFV